MTKESLPPPKLIKDQKSLQAYARMLNAQPIVAVDTESNSLYAYQEQVCLIQFSVPGEDALVDPLALDDLSALGPVFANEGVEKVFHAAEYDIMCLKRDFGFEFARLFDTMVTARILGRQGVGLGALLEEEFNVHLNKRYQRANWGKRPLPAEMLSYARLDTHYLIALRERLASKLGKSGLEPLAHEDFERLATLEAHNSHNSPEEDTWRVSGSQDLHPQNAAVLLELCRYRDRVARQIDRPLFKVIGDKTLLAIAQACPRSLNELKLIQGMSARQVGRHGRQLLEAVERGLQARPLHRPRPKRPDDGVLERVDALRNWRKKTARGMGVPSDVVLPRDLMYEIAYSDPAYKTDLQALLKEVPYRYKTFGEQILMTLSKH